MNTKINSIAIQLHFHFVLLLIHKLASPRHLNNRRKKVKVIRFGPSDYFQFLFSVHESGIWIKLSPRTEYANVQQELSAVEAAGTRG